MAVRQFKFYLVPATGILRVHGRIPAVLDEFRITRQPRVLEKSEEQPDYWLGESSDARTELASLLPERKSWSAESRMFGDNHKHSIEIWPDEVLCALDMSDFSHPLFEQILGHAAKFDLKVVIHGPGDVLEPEIGPVCESILKSNAYKFCRDPAGFLRQLPPLGPG